MWIYTQFMFIVSVFFLLFLIMKHEIQIDAFRLEKWSVSKALYLQELES